MSETAEHFTKPQLGCFSQLLEPAAIAPALALLSLVLGLNLLADGLREESLRD